MRQSWPRSAPPCPPTQKNRLTSSLPSANPSGTSSCDDARGESHFFACDMHLDCLPSPSGRGVGGEGAVPTVSPFRRHAQSEPSSNGCQGRWTIVYKPQPDTRKRPMRRRRSSVRCVQGTPPALDAGPVHLAQPTLATPLPNPKTRWQRGPLAKVQSPDQVTITSAPLCHVCATLGRWQSPRSRLRQNAGETSSYPGSCPLPFSAK
jgi:hypothetical protein